jgi:hypothetical protein
MSGVPIRASAGISVESFPAVFRVRVLRMREPWPA